MNKVLVTDPISEEGKKILSESSIEVIDALNKNLEDIDLAQINGWIIRSGTTITADLIKKSPNLKRWTGTRALLLGEIERRRTAARHAAVFLPPPPPPPLPPLPPPPLPLPPPRDGSKN